MKRRISLFTRISCSELSEKLQRISHLTSHGAVREQSDLATHQSARVTSANCWKICAQPPPSINHEALSVEKN